MVCSSILSLCLRTGFEDRGEFSQINSGFVNLQGISGNRKVPGLE